ncbi:MAG: hypothetical protein HQK96_05790 [Nitrospirae bacterium]|nr:hypothetical protein [Nitrospirota bacterium]
MQYSIVHYKELERTSRLDGEFYQPIFLGLMESLKNIAHEQLTNLCNISDGNHMSVAEYYIECGGIPYYRGQDVNTNFFLEDANPVFIPVEIYDRAYMKRSHFSVGDVLLSIVGTVGSLSLMTDYIQKATGSCKLAILRPKKIYPEYLSVFLMCRYGKLQIKRNIRGAVQTGLLLEDMGQIQVFIPNKKFEEKIRKIVLSSILKNRTSKSLYTQSERLLLSELGLLNWKPKHKLTFVKNFSNTNQAERFDAEYFQPKYEEIIEAVKKYNGGFDELGNLVKIKKSVEPGNEAYQESGVPFVRVSNISKFGISDNNQQFIPEELYSELNEHQPKKGELLLSKDATPGITYYLNEEPQKMIVSGGILRLKIDSQQVLPEYLTLVLNSVIVQKQIERDAGGSIISHWRPDQVEATIIPILKEDRQKEITVLIEKSFSDRHLSKSLLEIAKRGVEMAIEKTENEAEKWINSEIEKLGIKL